MRRLRIKIREAVSADMNFIKECVEKFRLDDEELDCHQFVVSVKGNEIIGFGRIRRLAETVELGTVGVVEGMRNQGIGMKIVKHLINVAPSDEVYVATDVTRFFEKLGFKKVVKGPCALINKISGVCKSKGRGDSIIMLHEKEARETD